MRAGRARRAGLARRVDLVYLVRLVYSVYLVYWLSLIQQKTRDKPNKQNNGLLMLADFFSVLL